MRGLPRSECHRHLGELLGFADHRDASAVAPGALLHLDRCATCRAESEQTALAIVALRRLGAEAAHAEPPADLWPTLRSRLGRRPAAWRWRAPLAGLLLSAGLVAVVLAPAAWLRPPPPFIQEVGLQASIFDAQRAAEDRGEARAMEQQLAARSRPVPPDEPIAAPAGSDGRWLGPDGLGIGRAAEPVDGMKPRSE